MDEMLLFAVVLLVVACAVMFGLCLSGRKSQTPKEDYCQEKARTEFSKMIVVAVLTMWVLSGLVGLWEVLAGRTSITVILNYVETASLASIGVYGLKSGAENCTKLSVNKEPANESNVNKEKYHEEH